VICALTLVGTAINVWRQEQGTERAKNQAISQSALTPQPTPAATPLPLPPGSASRWQEYLANNPPAPRAVLVQHVPRATLVKLPPPRAQLVRLPDLPIPGHQYLATMPYQNLEVLATYRGWRSSLDKLPQSGNQLGDMWLVEGTPWVWIFTPGATHADWIDP
jgi:hypothetical protein